MKNSNDTIRNRSRDLHTCKEVPQPTVPQRTPHCHVLLTYMSALHSLSLTIFYLVEPKFPQRYSGEFREQYFLQNSKCLRNEAREYLVPQYLLTIKPFSSGGASDGDTSRKAMVSIPDGVIGIFH